jgi:hypothetical protein
LRRNIHALIRGNGTRPGRPHIARDLLLLIALTLIGFQRQPRPIPFRLVELVGGIARAWLGLNQLLW